MVICDICTDSYEDEMMADVDTLSCRGDHGTLRVCPICHDGIMEQRKQENMMQVTREMAIDAGDRTLEGKWIEW